MTIRKLPNGRYEADFTYTHPLTGEEKRFRRWTPHTSKRRAARWEAEWRTRVTDRNYWLERREKENAEKTPTIKEFRSTFLRRLKGRVADSTIELYRSRLKVHIVPAIGDCRLDQVTTEEVDDLFAEMLQKGKSHNLIDSVAVCLGSMFTRAERWELISSDDRPDITPPKDTSEADKPVRYFTHDEVEAIREAVPAKISTMVKLALSTGMRVGEIQALQWDDISFQEQLISVLRTWTREGFNSPKGGRRTIPFTDRTEARLKAHRETDFAGETFVFQIGDEEPPTRNQLRSPMDVMKRDAGLNGDRLGWHNLRHTFASRLATKGVSLRLIQKLLGHSSIKVTEIYAHLLPQSTNKARGYLEELAL